MRKHRVAAVLAGTGLMSLLMFYPTFAERAPERPAFDPLFAQGAICTPAQAQPRTETRPFQPGQAAPAPAQGDASPPLYRNLGKLHVPITTADARAQAYFDQGLRLSFAFNHAEAVRAFRAARRIDPHCAMCYWGEALALGPNINAPMFPEAVAPAHAASAAALRLAPGTRPHEQALIHALARRYAAAPPDDRAPLDRAYADAMAEAARAFPADDTIQVLYAESLMDLAPWGLLAGRRRPAQGAYG
jgi:hypothetical protein